MRKIKHITKIMNWGLLASVFMLASCDTARVFDSPSFTDPKDDSSSARTDAKLIFEFGSNNNFGNVDSGSNDEVTVSIRNSGVKTADSIAVSEALAAPFEFKGGTYPGMGGSCDADLSTEETCEIVLIYAPVTEGIFSDILTLGYESEGEAKTVSFGLTGNSGGAELEISDGPTYVFAQSEPAEIDSKTFTVTNTGALKASLITDSGLTNAPFNYKGGDFPGTGGTCAGFLNASASCTLVVEFSPTAYGIFNGVIGLGWASPQGVGTVGIALNGQSGDGANIVITDFPSFDFGSIEMNSIASRTFTLTNQGATAASSLGDDTLISSPFRYKGGVYPGTGGNCASSLNAGANCNLVVEYAPTSVGSFNSSVGVVYVSGVTPLAAAVTLTGDAVPVAPAPIANVSVTGIGINELEISWSAPSDNGTAITDYLIEYKLTSSGTWLSYVDGASTDTSVDILGLTDDTSYDFRVRSTNGATSSYSNTATGETAVDNPFFGAGYKAMNLGGATKSQVVAFYDDTTISINGVPIVTADPSNYLHAGEVHAFVSSQNYPTVVDVIDADKPIFVAGKIGSGSQTLQANVVWNTPDWAGKDFVFTGTRDNPHAVTVYAFEATDVSILQSGAQIYPPLPTAPISLLEGETYTFSVNALGGFQLQSTGLIVAYKLSVGSGKKTDSIPLLPASTDIVGIPSGSGKVTTGVASADYDIYHSNSFVDSWTVALGGAETVTAQGTSTHYNAEAVRLTSVDKIVANSNADGDGGDSAPFLPTAMMKKRYAINTVAEWVVFASLQPGTITLIDPADPDNPTPVTVSLVRTGAEANAPCKAKIDGVAAGYKFISDVPMAGWYESDDNVNGSTEDETILFGTDDTP